MMQVRYHLMTLGLLIALTACSGAAKRPNLYELPGRTAAPVDNDYYYVPPQGASCVTINDLPSCSGGG